MATQNSSSVYSIDCDRLCPAIFDEKRPSCLQVQRLVREQINEKQPLFCLPDLEEVFHPKQLTRLSVVCRSLSTSCSKSSTNFCSMKANDGCQIFYIRSARSWARLKIQRSLFEDLIAAYEIFPQIWDFIFAFGIKDRDRIIGQPPFRTCPNRKMSMCRSRPFGNLFARVDYFYAYKY